MPTTVEVTRVVEVVKTVEVIQTKEVVVTATVTPRQTSTQIPTTIIASPVITQTPDDVDCRDTAMTQREMNACAGSKASEATEKLTRLMGELKDTLDDKKWNELQHLQEQWEQFKDENCQWEADFFEGGSVQPMMYAGCLEDYNLQRIKQLKYFLCDGAVMAGPCPASNKY
jgi:uncharacterized protein YecT (DUF1311 family)